MGKFDGQYKDMQQAYKASSKILEKRMQKDRPLDLEILKKVNESSIIIVAGVYDKIELVLDLINIPYVLIQPGDFDKINLRSDQILIINCPGEITEGLSKIKDFVKKGGFLFTTDWALSNVLEKIFLKLVRYNKKPTADDCVRVEVVDKSNKFLEGLFQGESDPIWWLESSSYPIEILDSENVKVLVTSREMKEKYGEAPIVITFDYGDGGTVLHMTSHYYLQKSELRTKRHKSTAKEYLVSEMGFSDKEADDIEELDGLSLGEAENAYSTTQFISNVIVEQQKKVKKRKQQKK
ncbi:MAG: hypothetical protein ACFFD1_03445 [Candidatus Thorarchaeota archaeon]